MLYLLGVFFLICYLCEKYYKSIIAMYYVAKCISWVPNVVEFMNKLDLQMPSGTELVSMRGTFLSTVIYKKQVFDLCPLSGTEF